MKGREISDSTLVQMFGWAAAVALYIGALYDFTFPSFGV